MLKRKIECGNGWIVFIVTGSQVVQVHSTGEVTHGNDDSAADSELISILCNNAYVNKLNSQQYGKGGVRWPEE